jgi:hypothetical protein
MLTLPISIEDELADYQNLNEFRVHVGQGLRVPLATLRAFAGSDCILEDVSQSHSARRVAFGR